jgi:hypothetical protein
VVHLPIALTLLVPVFAFGTLVAIRRGARPLRAWGITTALLATLSLSAWVSLETGGDQAERVEEVVPENAIHSHEEGAEAFLTLSVVVLAVAGAGLVQGRIGSAARIAAAVGTLALVVSGYTVGHSGGALVYEFGAANAYVTPSASFTATDREPARGTSRERRGDDDDR